MEKINFSVQINAPKEKVWEMLWNPDAYRAWTSAFCEGSYAETDNWKEGSKVLFLDGKGSGMASMVATHRPNEFMSFRHLGFVKDGMEDISSDAVKSWAGATENYSIAGENGASTLAVEMDTTGEFKDYMMKTMPVALEKVKGLAEGTVRTVISIETEVNASIEKVWNCWTAPEHIVNWCHASDDWHAPAAENDLRTGGRFKTVMAAKDGSFSFDFGGVYTEVKENAVIEYTMDDSRKVKIVFENKEGKIHVSESFEAENMNSLELQRTGWQAILDNFKKYTERM